jgi:LysR family transcriptional regulator, glycine cleavage system transcriptional activator
MMGWVRASAIDGQGVALARTTLAAWDLLLGRLVVPIDVALPLENTYWIVHPKLASHEAKVVTLRDWLLAEAAYDERRLRTVVAPKSGEVLSVKTLDGLF